MPYRFVKAGKWSAGTSRLFGGAEFRREDEYRDRQGRRVTLKMLVEYVRKYRIWEWNSSIDRGWNLLPHYVKGGESRSAAGAKRAVVVAARRELRRVG